MSGNELEAAAAAYGDSEPVVTLANNNLLRH